VTDHIEWRLGFLPHSELAPLLGSATVVVLPYREIESSGVLALAIGHGRPAVVSALGAVGETVLEFEAGRVFPTGDVPALARACCELLGDEAALERAYEGAMAARAALTWDDAAQAHELLYEEALGRASVTVAAR